MYCFINFLIGLSTVFTKHLYNNNQKNIVLHLYEILKYDFLIRFFEQAINTNYTLINMKNHI